MKTTLTLFFFLIVSFTCNAKELSGISLKETFTYDTTTLQLQGAGIRDKFFMDLYIASFYTLKPYQDTTALLNADEPMALSLHILSSLITSEKMEEATREGFINATGGNTAALQKEIEMFIAIFKEPISLNDRYDFLYLPSKGVLISKNGLLKSTIEGLAFKKALFGIWLGDKPAQESLKKNLLGKQ